MEVEKILGRVRQEHHQVVLYVFFLCFTLGCRNSRETKELHK